MPPSAPAARRRTAPQRPAGPPADRTQRCADDSGARDAIIDAAGELFAERGFSGVTVRDIVKRAGANLGSLSYHFRCKEGLYLAVIGVIVEGPEAPDLARLVAEAPTAAESATGLARAIAACVRAILRGFFASSARPWCHRLILRELMEPTAAWHALLERIVLPEVLLLAELFRKAHPDADELQARLWALTLHSHLTLHTVATRHLHLFVGSSGRDAAFIRAFEDHVVRVMVASAGLPWPPADP